MENTSKTVVITDKQDDDILFVLEVTNYDADGLDVALKEARNNFEQQEGDDDGVYEHSLEDCILAALENYGYDYEFTGFEIARS